MAQPLSPVADNGGHCRRGIKHLRQLDICPPRRARPTSFCGLILFPHAASAKFWGQSNSGLCPTLPELEVSWKPNTGVASLFLTLLKKHHHRPGSHKPGSMSPRPSLPAFLYILGRRYGEATYRKRSGRHNCWKEN